MANSSRRRKNQTVLVHRIDLSDKSYTPTAAQVIADFITTTQHAGRSLTAQISSLDLSDCIAGRPTDDGLAVLKILSNAWVGATSLEHINLSENAMGTRGIECCEALFSPLHLPLKSLPLCNNGLSSEAMEQVADWLVSREMAPNLHRIHFYNNMSGDDGCEAFKNF